jgi:uncharacterized protein YndB with AHSA1/START domain
VDGRLEQRDDRWQLHFSRRLPHPPEKVWRALTEPEHLAAWFPADIEGERTAGAPLRFVFREGEGPPIDGEMLACEAPTRLEFTWGDDVLRFDVRPDGDGSVLELVNTFDEHGKAARDAAGWHTCLDLLALRLDARAAPWTPAARWQAVHPAYVERFGPEAAAIGPPEPVDGPV